MTVVFMNDNINFYEMLIKGEVARKMNNYKYLAIIIGGTDSPMVCRLSCRKRVEKGKTVPEKREVSNTSFPNDLKMLGEKFIFFDH